MPEGKTSLGAKAVFALGLLLAGKAINRLLAVQEALGPEFPIAVETHALLIGPTAVEMAQDIASAKINCMWYEEPAGPEFPNEIAAIRRQIRLPVCWRVYSFAISRAIDSRKACR